MFEEVDSIDWQSMGYPQVPELLKQLISEDGKIQVEAAYRLEAEVILGGLDWEDFDLGKGVSTVLRNNAPLLLVPFLLKLLDPDVASGKSNVLYILSRMLHYKVMIISDGEDIYKQRIEKVRTAIWEGRFIYLDLLSSKDIDVRKAALDILLDFDEYGRILEAFDLIVRRFEPRMSS